MNLIESLFFHSINNSLITNLSEMLSKEDILQNFKRGPDWRPTEVFSGTIQLSNKCCLLNAFGSVCILFLAMMNVNVYETFFFCLQIVLPKYNTVLLWNTEQDWWALPTCHCKSLTEDVLLKKLHLTFLILKISIMELIEWQILV